MNNEPVAVYINKDDGLVCAKCFNPLYTNPAQTLTDEEITYFAKRFEGVWSGEVDYKGFARAILRKAKEK